MSTRAAFEAERLRREGNTRLLITIGADELPGMVEDAERLAASLAPLAAKGFHSLLIKFADEGHVSVLPAAISRMLEFALADPVKAGGAI
ncbi:hypothetical protein GCM10010912_64070 [Paenibacillus albidus]|uniref:Uncharacterized protein n=1 Tax=Paenibacillus albidus TaxID=2041023 RepID=A0A917D5X9_9BACL|nr:hypothetical protein [Paenibacillus albidus]GGG10836.1 hypothetical protein GCM10010912_64070 [Paenibacillus albidus]